MLQCPLNTGASMHSRLNVVRRPNIRVRQAVRDNNVPLLARLQHRINLRNVDKQRLSSLAWAALELNLEVFEWLLLDYGHDDQELSRDAEHNTIFHMLAGAAAPPNLSPLSHLSSPQFPPRLSTRSTEEKVEIVLRMTDVYYTLFPFLLDWSNNSGKTALHYAAQADNHEFIVLLCDLGADVDLADLMGNTPLHYASAWGNASSIKVLLERGAAANTRNMDGFTPTDFAYTNSIKNATDAMSKEVTEDRRRRKEEMKRERALSESESWHDNRPYEHSLPPDIVAAAAAANQARLERRGSRSTFPGNYDGRPLERLDQPLETFEEADNRSASLESSVTPRASHPQVNSGLGLHLDRPGPLSPPPETASPTGMSTEPPISPWAGQYPHMGPPRPAEGPQTHAM